MRRNSKTTRLLNLFVALFTCVAFSHCAFSQTRAKIPSAPTVVPKGAPYTLRQLIEMAPLVRSRSMRIQRAQVLLTSRGVAFALSPDSERALREAGATEAFIALIKSVAPLEVPTSKPTPKEVMPVFTLVVTCDPPECEIRVNDSSFLPTHAGKIEFPNLSPGRIIVDAKKDGYELVPQIFNLQDTKTGEIVTKPLRLSPTEATQLKWGSALYNRMMTAVKEGSARSQISGALTIRQAETDSWDVVASLQPRGAAQLELSRQKQRVSVTCVDWRCGVAEKGSFLHSSPFRGSKEERLIQESHLMRHIEIWLQSEYSTLLSRMANSKAAVKTVEETSKEMHVSLPAGAYTVSVDADLRPSSVRFDGVIGVAPSTIVNYLGYGPTKGGLYPATTDIRLPDAPNHTVSFAIKEFSAGSAK